MNPDTHTNSESKKVLLVEDDTFLRDLISLKIAHAGIQLLQASTGEAALEIITKDKPDLVLLDIVLPGMSGFDVLEHIRADKDTENTSVMIVSNLGQEKDLIRAKKLGVSQFLVKINNTPSEIMRHIEDALGLD